MTEVWLDAAENRLNALENIVFGTCSTDREYPKIEKKIVDKLAEFHETIESTTKKHGKITAILRRIDEIEKYLDPVYASRLTLDQEAKIAVVLAAENKILKTVDDIKKIESLTSSLDSAHIKSVPSLVGKLKDLYTINVQQEGQSEQLAEETKELCQRYNTIITLLSKQFLLWEDTLSRLEEKKNGVLE